MSCAKAAEPIETQSGMLTQRDPRNMYTSGTDTPTGIGTLGVSSRLKSIVKHMILGVG